MTGGAWHPVLVGDDARRARSVALDVAARLLDPEHASRSLRHAATEIDLAGAPPRSWNGPGLSGAGATAAVLCAELDALEPAANWDRRGHACLATASSTAANAPLGLFDGVAGMGFAAQRLARGRERYGNLTLSVDEAVARLITARWSGRMELRGLPVREWDLISGITGIGAYLLVRSGDPDARRALERTLAALVALASDTGATARWATPPQHLFGYLQQHNPDGALNCGVAHGIIGPLALLSLALTDGIEVAGQSDAVRTLAGWVSARAYPGPWGPQWPAAISVADQTPTPARPGWCYGNAGVARPLWLAGAAVGDEALQALALSAIRQALARQAAERSLDAPTLCHGIAGLALVALRMAADSGATDVSDDARALCLELLNGYDATAGFGYRDVTAAADGRRLEVDDPTLLAGAAGPALVLLAAASDVEPGWDRALLLA